MRLLALTLFWGSEIDLSLGYVSYQRDVGFQEVIGRKFFGADPAHLTKDTVFDFAVKLSYQIEAKFHRCAVFICMPDDGGLRPDPRAYSQLFFQFAV